MKKWMVAWGALAFLLAGCTQQPEQDKVVVISAASSLMDVTEQLKEPFAAIHPDWELVFTYNSSSKLATQIRQGAEVDLFLSADLQVLEELRYEDLLQYDLIPFAYNRLVLGSSGEAYTGQDVLDLLQEYPGQIVAGEPESVPLGHYTKQWFEEVGLLESYKDRFIYAKDARQVLTYLESGNAELGVLYYSDAVNSKKLNGFTLLPPLHEDIGYYAAVLEDSDASEQAQTVIDLLLEEQGQNLLQDYGFLSVHEELTE